MARLPRIVLPNQPLHIMHRGNNRQDVFKQDNDYQRFLEDLAIALTNNDCSLHAYVLMTNHFHLLLSPPSETALSCFMQAMGRRYVRYFNKEYKRSGTLWEGRYRSSLIDSERYLLTCYRYIEENPVRAGMVASPEQYTWSSYHHNALGKPNDLITEHQIYQQIATTELARITAYKGLFERSLPSAELKDVSISIDKSDLLGGNGFYAEVASKIGFNPIRSKHGGDRKSELFKEQNQQL